MKILITIIDRKMCPRVLKMFEELKVNFNTILHGKGSANSELLQYFGLAETEKSVIFSIVSKKDAPEILENIFELFEFSRRGTGVAFTIPIKSIGKKTLSLLRGEKMEGKNE